MNDHNGTGTGCDSLLDERIINLQGFSGGFDKHRFQTILCDSEDRGNVRVCWHDNLVTILHHT